MKWLLCLWVNSNRGEQQKERSGKDGEQRSKGGIEKSGPVVLHERNEVFIFSRYTVVTPGHVGHFSHYM